MQEHNGELYLVESVSRLLTGAQINWMIGKGVIRGGIRSKDMGTLSEGESFCGVHGPQKSGVPIRQIERSQREMCPMGTNPIRLRFHSEVDSGYEKWISELYEPRWRTSNSTSPRITQKLPGTQGFGHTTDPP